MRTTRTTKQKGDVLAGVIGYRDKDGTVIKTVPFYAAPDEPAKNGELTDDEKAVCDQIIPTMVAMFGEYVRKSRALDRANKKKIELQKLEKDDAK